MQDTLQTLEVRLEDGSYIDRLLAAWAAVHIYFKVVNSLHGCQPPHQKPGCPTTPNRGVTTFLVVVIITSLLLYVVELSRL
jgi:hypothetical protein